MRSRSLAALIALLLGGGLLGGLVLAIGGFAGGPGIPPSEVGALVWLALADAVNPCALAVLLVLLTSVLTRYPDRQDRVLAAGFAFIAAVLLVYGGMGIVAITGLKWVKQSVEAVQVGWLRQALGVFAMLLALLNFKDWISHGAGGFVMEVPRSWRPSMQRYMTDPLWRFRSVVVGSFLAGFVVSLFLLPCTSGPYVIAVLFLADQPWTASLPLLVLYNVAFVLPMVAVTVVVYGGLVSVERIGSWREENVEWLHFAAGVVLFTLGLLLVFEVV